MDASRQEMADVLKVQFGRGDFTSPLLPYMHHGPSEFQLLRDKPDGEKLHGFLATTMLPGSLSYIDQVTANPRQPRKRALTKALLTTLDRLDREEQDTLMVASPLVRTFDAYVESDGVAYDITAQGEYRGRYPRLRRMQAERGRYISKMLDTADIRALGDVCGDEVVQIERDGVPLLVCRVPLQRGVSPYDFHETPEGRALYGRLQDLFAAGWVLTRAVRTNEDPQGESSFTFMLEQDKLQEGDANAQHRLNRAWGMLHDMRAA
jgi:hypothetical protein